MRMLYFRVKGYTGIFAGTGKKEISIDFSKTKYRITAIYARNGGGKTTLLEAMQPYPESNDSFLPGEEAEKEIVYDKNGIIYRILLCHGMNINGTRATTKGYIEKTTDNGVTVQLNPIGNITTYREILQEEFKLDPCFMVLSKISTEDKGIVNKTPAEKRAIIGKSCEKVDIYNALLKTLNKRISNSKAIMNNITSKIEIIGNSDNLQNTLNTIVQLIKSGEAELESLKKQKASLEAKVELLDPDGTIITGYHKLNTNLSIIKKELDIIVDDLVSRFNSLNLIQEDWMDESNTIKYRSKLVETNMNAVINLDNIRNQISLDTNRRDSLNKELNTKMSKIQSIQSEYNFQELKNYMTNYEIQLDEYNNIIKQMNIDVNILSKDEFVTGLHILKDIKDQIFALKSFYSVEVYGSVILSGRELSSVINEKEQKELKLIELKTEEHEHHKMINYYEGLTDRLSILNNRPVNCKIDTCPFIEDAVNTSKLNPLENLKQCSLGLASLEKEISLLENSIKLDEDTITILNSIRLIERVVQTNHSILKKLPIGKSFIDKDEFRKRLLDERDIFEDIDILYSFIEKANVITLYNQIKDSLNQIRNDYKLYESKNEIVETLKQEQISLSEEINNLIIKISENRNKVSQYESTLEINEKELIIIDSIIDRFNSYHKAISNHDEISNSINGYGKDIETINNALEEINTIDLRIINISNTISPHYKERDKIVYNLQLLEDYKKDLKKINESYNKQEIVKQYINPNKKGIQNVFISVYMGNTLNLANDLLSNFFDGRLRLMKYKIGENGEFSIPCLSLENNIVVEDISYCSRSEKAMIGMILGGVLLKQSSTEWDIFRMDEVDEGLDVSNRLSFMKTYDNFLDIMGIEQSIMITHSAEVTGDMDIIKLEQPETTVTELQGNIIFEL